MIQRWAQQIWRPKVDDQKLHQILAAAHQRLPSPVIWLFGKAQSGKTSIIRALTGRDDAEIGRGFKPCTRTARLYSYPAEDTCIMQFLDTRGLGETGYDPGEDLKFLEPQSHLLMVVLKARDHAQQPVIQPLMQIATRHPQWPIVVVQTTLHEGYPPGTTRHPHPYPFDAFPFPSSVPLELAQSLAHQRAWFTRLRDRVRFVCVDLTPAREGFDPPDYGLDALRLAIAEVGPLALRALFDQDADTRVRFRDAYFAAAHPQIVGHSIAAGLAATVPVPAIDTAASLAVVGKMFHALASIYGQKLTLPIVGEMAGCLGIGFALRVAGRSVAKMVPGLGVVISLGSGVYMAACTYALGRTLSFYFDRVRDGSKPSSTRLHEVYAEAFRRGLQMSTNYFQGVQEAT